MSLLAPILALALIAQGEKPTATVKLDKPTATVGQAVKGTLTLTLPSGLHGYQNPPASEYENPITLKVVEKTFKFGKIEYPKGVEYKMEGATEASMVYEGVVTIPFTLIPTKLPAKGAAAISFQVDYQLCSSSNCWPPSNLTVKVPLKVVAAPKKAKA